MITTQTLIDLSALLPFLLGLWIKSGVLLAAGLLIAKLHRWSAAERHGIVVAALVGVLLLPVASLVTPNLSVTIGPASNAAKPAARGSGLSHPDALEGPAAEDPRRGGPTSTVPAPRFASAAAPDMPLRSRLQSINVDVALVTLYLLVAAALLAYFGYSAFRLSRLTRSWAPVEDEATRALFDDTRASLGIQRRVRLVRSTSGHTPWVWGALSPVVVLPPTFRQWPIQQQRQAIVHELSHVARRDLLTSLSGCVCAALLWPQPLVWLALRTMTLEGERACDDRVLLAGTSDATYAAQLLKLAKHVYLNGRNPLAAQMASSSSVAQRIQSILDSEIRRDAMNPSKRALVLVAALGVVGALSPLEISRSQETPGTEASGQLTLPTFQALVRNGAQSDADLRLIVETFVENERESDATQAFVNYISRPEPGNEVCSYCASLLLTETQSVESDAVHAALRFAFRELEQRAYAASDGRLLYRLAWISIDSANRTEVARGTWYLFEALRVGNTAKRDAVKWLAIRALYQLGRFEDAKALAEELYSDPESKYYESAEMGRWTKYLDREMGRASALSARLLSVDDGRPVTEQDYVPIYKAAPRYPETAAKERKEGDVVVEFTVNRQGRTENVFVVQSSDVVFESAALEAARQFLYMPKIVNGASVDQPGVKNKITFSMTP